MQSHHISSRIALILRMRSHHISSRIALILRMRRDRIFSRIQLTIRIVYWLCLQTPPRVGKLFMHSIRLDLGHGWHFTSHHYISNLDI